MSARTSLSAEITMSADITAFSLILGSLDGRKSSRSVVAMLALHEDADCPLELDVDVNPYAVPFKARFEPGQALLSDGSLMPDGCGALEFVAPFTPFSYAEIEPVLASMEVRVSLPEAAFEALWSTFAIGRSDLLATVRFEAGPFEHVLPPGWQWNTVVESHLRVVRASVAFTAPGWPDWR